MTLNDAAKYTKRGIAYFLIFLVLYIFVENLYRGFSLVYSRAFPDPPNPPEIGFGRIENLKIATLPIELDGVEFRRNLSTQGFPNFPSNIRVYKIEEPIISVAKEEKFKDIARILGFQESSRKITDSRRLWIDTENNRELEAEIYFENFRLKTNKSVLENRTTAGNAPSSQEAIENTRQVFRDIGLWNNEFEGADYETSGVEINEGIIREAEVPYRERLKYVSIAPRLVGNESQIVNQDGQIVNRSERYKVYFKDPTKSNINTLISNQGRSSVSSMKVTDINYIYYNILEESYYYPIITPERAWNNLLEGRASLVYLKREGSDFFSSSDAITNIDVIDINEMQIGYYMSDELLKHLQPIYIFSGKLTTTQRESGDIYFYLPAIDPQALINN